MSKQHSASAAFVKVSIGSPSGNRVAVILRRGDIVPDGVAEEQLERLTERGLIEVVPEPVDEAAEAKKAAAEKAKADKAEAAKKAAAEKAAAEKKAAEDAAAKAAATPPAGN